MDIIRVLSTELVNFLFIAVKNLNFVVAASGVGLGLKIQLTLNKNLHCNATQSVRMKIPEKTIFNIKEMKSENVISKFVDSRGFGVDFG